MQSAYINQRPRSSCKATKFFLLIAVLLTLVGLAYLHLNAKSSQPAQVVFTRPVLRPAFLQEAIDAMEEKQKPIDSMEEKQEELPLEKPENIIAQVETTTAQRDVLIRDEKKPGQVIVEDVDSEESGSESDDGQTVSEDEEDYFLMKELDRK